MHNMEAFIKCFRMVPNVSNANIHWNQHKMLYTDSNIVNFCIECKNKMNDFIQKSILLYAYLKQ